MCKKRKNAVKILEEEVFLAGMVEAVFSEEEPCELGIKEMSRFPSRRSRRGKLLCWETLYQHSSAL